MRKRVIWCIVALYLSNHIAIAQKDGKPSYLKSIFYKNDVAKPFRSKISLFLPQTKQNKKINKKYPSFKFHWYGQSVFCIFGGFSHFFCSSTTFTGVKLSLCFQLVIYLSKYISLIAALNELARFYLFTKIKGKNRGIFDAIGFVMSFL